MEENHTLSNAVNAVSVSVIVPVYNSTEYLNICLGSVINNDFSSFEIIAVDSGSADNSPAILSEYASMYPERFRVLKTEHHQFAGAVKNLGLREAKGEYIVFCEPGDEMPSDAIRNLYNTAQRTDAEAVFSPHYEISGGKRSLKRRNEELGDNIGAADIIMNMEPSLWGKMFRKSFLDTAGDIPEDICCEDTAWFYGCVSRIKKAALCRIPTYIRYIRNREDASSGAHIRETVKSGLRGLSRCDLAYRDIAEYRIVSEFGQNMSSRHEWIEYLRELWPEIRKNPFLQRDTELFGYLKRVVERSETKADTGSCDIKIFVSHRIDMDSCTVDNPLYVNVRCGAVYDTKKSVSALGDDTGDNISEKRIRFNEFTVQYWAWKNVEAEYYGLCHYRRYLSFTDRRFQTNEQGFVALPRLDKNTAAAFGLLDTAAMQKMITQYDMIIAEPPLVSECVSPIPHGDTVRELWEASKLIEISAIDLMMDLIGELMPQYSRSAEDYMAGKLHRGYNCYIMKRELFGQLCNFQFTILFELENRLDMSGYSGNMCRTPAYIGEILYGIFLHHLILQGNIRIKEVQLLYFQDTEKTGGAARIKNFGKRILRTISPAYRVSLRNEVKLEKNERSLAKINAMISKQTEIADNDSLELNYTANSSFKAACFANEVRDVHKASFSEFKNCHIGKSVVVVACGPSMKYYTQIGNAPHIGVNAAFKNENIKLDYFFTTDYEHKNEWFEDLKNHDFVKFFGQYSAGAYRGKYQIIERLIEENNARRFFQGAPSEDIHLNIEYYPLMGFYSVVFQAIHFAVYTRPKKLYLVGCDCTGSGYFDGSKQFDRVEELAVPSWKKGYEKFREFAESFYPDMEIISVNPVGLKGVFHDVYTEEFLNDHPGINRDGCEIVDLNSIE